MKFKVTSVAPHETNHVQVTASAVAEDPSPYSPFGPASNSLLILHLNVETAKQVQVGDFFSVEKIKPVSVVVEPTK